MRLQLVIIHFLWQQLVPSVPRSSSSSCIVALIAPHTTSCFIVNTAAAPYCTYDQKVMRRLFRLLTAAGFIHTKKKKKKKASTAVKQLTWEQKKQKQKARKVPFAHWTFCTALLFSPSPLHQGQRYQSDTRIHEKRFEEDTASASR